jgi:hypothetical protein
LEAINGLHFNINSYVEMRGDTDDYRAHMEKKIKSGNPNPVQDNKG